jgi:hypothetical protein
MSALKSLTIAACFGAIAHFQAGAAENVNIVDVPDYSWYAGCFGTASGNLMGYWDRHGFPNFYTGPTAGGVAPLSNSGANMGIESLWVSRAGFDGRPADQPGHGDDYWQVLTDFDYSYQSTATDPYILAGRPEHAPDCICDFMGSSQNKWADLDGECSGNIDAFSFNFWDKKGARRVNFTPPLQNGVPIRDIQSGWRNWTEYRGNRADVFSQLADPSVNPNTPAGTGFTFADLKAEIDAGYPLMLFLQNPNEFSRSLPGMDRANPEVHGMIAYGYIVTDDGTQYVRYRTSWGSGDLNFAQWGPQSFEAQLSLRGVVGYHPLPQIKSVTRGSDGVDIQWDGPQSILSDNNAGTQTQVHWYVVEKSASLDTESFVAVTDPTPNLQATVPNSSEVHEFYRVRLVPPPSTP